MHEQPFVLFFVCVFRALFTIVLRLSSGPVGRAFVLFSAFMHVLIGL